MRRDGDRGLVKSELRLLLTACELYVGGDHRFHGYQLARHLQAAEAKPAIMTQPTLYRSLRRLEERGALVAEWEASDEAAADGRDGQPRRYYRVTEKGVAAARRALRDLNLGWSDRSLREVELGIGR